MKENFSIFNSVLGILAENFAYLSGVRAEWNQTLLSNTKNLNKK